VTLNSLENYGISFQTKVISALLTDKSFLQNVNDILNEDYFSNSAQKWIVNESIKYYNKYHCNPTMDVLKTELKRVENDILQISIKEQLKEAYSLSEGNDLPYIKTEFTNFCKNQQLKNALLNSVDLLKEGDYDSIRRVVNNALKSGQDRNIGHEYNKDVETRYRDEERSPIPFPWNTFNKITQGGYGKGDLVLIFGNPKGGKSWSIVAMAAEAMRLGYNVIYYALELGESYVGKRFDAYFTGIPVDEIDKHRDKVDEIMSSIPGKLIIKGYSPKRASLSTIETHINQVLEQERNEDSTFNIDAVFIDYLDLLKNRNSRKERKDDIDDVYTDAKGLAKELDIPIISPSQANRSGAEKDILESSHIAGSFDKIMIGDIIISLARGRKDRLNGTGRWHIMGNRYGVDGVTYSSTIDTKTGHIEIDEDELDLDIYEKSSSKPDSIGVFDDEKEFLRNQFVKMDL